MYYARIDEAFNRKNGTCSNSDSLKRQPDNASIVESDFPKNYRVKRQRPKESRNYVEDADAYVSNPDYNCGNRDQAHDNRRHNAYDDRGYDGRRDREQIGNFMNYECFNLINQVLQNERCKRLLRNILLDEYLDQLIKNKIDGMSKPNVNLFPHPTSSDCKPSYYPNKELIEGFNFVQPGPGGVGGGYTIFGLDLKTIMVLILIAIVCLYIYDILNRLFR